MSENIMRDIEFQRNKRRYLSTLRYLKHIKKTGKIHLLTRSQINAIRSRLTRYLASIKQFLKLATLSTGLFAASIVEVDAQCRMNRSPISTQTSFATTHRAGSTDFVDIDEDGDFDLVTGSTGEGIISTYVNEDGFFKPVYGLLNPFNGYFSPYTVYPTFVDIDNDGDSDAFMGGRYGTIRYYKNDDGAFTRVTGAGNPLDTVNVGSFASPTFIDIDSDGDPDVFVGERYGTIHYFRNDNNVFTPVTGADNPFNLVDVGDSGRPTFVDIEGDGDPDAFIGASDGSIKFYRNDDDIFSKVTGVEDPLNGVNVGSSAAPKFFDIDSDGDPDLYIVARGVIYFYRNDNGALNEQRLPTFPFNHVVEDAIVGPTLADLDGDNDDDLIIGTWLNGIKTFYNTNGVYIEAIGENNPFNGIDEGDRVKPILVDLDPTDTDTDLDLVIGKEDGTIAYYRNVNGSFIPLIGFLNPLASVDVEQNAAPTFVDFDQDNDKDAFVGARDGTIHYYRNDNGFFVEVMGAGNPFNDIDVGYEATPSFFLFDASRAIVGNSNGTIKEYEKDGSRYVEVDDSPFIGIDVKSRAAPVLLVNKVIIGNSQGNIFEFRDQGGRSNVWQGLSISNWHGAESNWELMAIPKSGCDNVHVLESTILKIDPTQIGEGRTLKVRQGGQFEVKAAAELSIEPN